MLGFYLDSRRTAHGRLWNFREPALWTKRKYAVLTKLPPARSAWLEFVASSGLPDESTHATAHAAGTTAWVQARMTASSIVSPRRRVNETGRVQPDASRPAANARRRRALLHSVAHDASARRAKAPASCGSWSSRTLHAWEYAPTRIMLWICNRTYAAVLRRARNSAARSFPQRRQRHRPSPRSTVTFSGVSG